MIPHPSAGIQPWANQSRVPSGLRTDDLTGSRVDRPSMSATPACPGQQPVIDLTGNDSGLPEGEPPNKRPRLATNVSGDGRTANRSATLRSAPPPSGGATRSATFSGRGRPACSFQDLLTETYGGGVLTGNAVLASQTPKPATPPPFPVRPWKYTPSQQTGASTTAANESTPEREVQTTAYRPEVPTIAPLIKNDRVADYSPWTGNHPEDVLNEQTTKQGHYDRTQVSQNESNTARPSLYAQLKHRSGLQVLSSVFAAVLEKRQAHTKVTSASTFKPPPRVTLTDNKREAWLRDLANPMVPLRRLSRTIPHGIRGKVLLDQCLSKEIPIGRAVWFAKCVGANEIRAFKRKGTSGSLAQGLEMKWVRDWTSSVHQFLEGVISICGKGDWKSKMNYSVRLAARLFFENLLDQDFHLDWFLSSLENASLSTLPIWMLVLGIYWIDFTKFRKRGRRLAEALLEKLRQMKAAEPSEVFQPLVVRLALLVRRLTRESPSSMVLPRSWARYQDLISSSLDLADPLESAIYQSLLARNLRVQKAKDCSQLAERSPKQQSIRFLDASRSVYDMVALSHACLTTVADRAVLVSALLEWTATSFRHGLVRVYIAARLLRKWKKSGMDLDGHVLSFLSKSHSKSTMNLGNVYHVIVELIRSQTFSVGRYLQWLVARGAVEQHRQEASSMKGSSASFSSDVELLSQLPVSRLPQHLRNHRDTLMVRAGLCCSEEEVTNRLKADLQQRLPAIFGTDVYNDSMVGHVAVGEVPWSVKAEVGQWIRGGVSEHYGNDSSFSQKSAESFVEISCLTLDEFFTIRNTLEGYGDLSMLADVLSDAANSDDVLVLASAVDTLNRHFDCFCVIGASADLFRKFFEAFLRVRQNGQFLYDLTFALIEVGHRLPGEMNTVVALRQEFSKADRKFAAAACSPVSDHMADALNDANPSFNDEMDQFLSSGNSMDETTLMSVFQKLIQQLELCDNPAKFQSSAVCHHLMQLRSFNPKQFDLLLIRWIEGLFRSSHRPKLVTVLAPLIGIGCVTLPAFSALVRKVLSDASARSSVANLPQFQLDFIELFVPGTQKDPCNDLLSYRYQIAQEEFLLKHANEAFSMVEVTASLLMHTSTAYLDVQASWEKCTISLLRELLVRHPDETTHENVQKLLKNTPAAVNVVRRTLDLLLGFNIQPGDEKCFSEAEKAIDMTDDFSLPFCQMKLQLLFNMDGGDDVKNRIVDVMFNMAVADVQAGHTHWLDLVALMSRDAVEQIRQQAEKGFFAVGQSDSALEGESELERGNLRENARVYLTIIDGLAYSIPDGGIPSVAPLLVEKTNALLQQLAMTQMTIRNLGENRTHATAEQLARTLALSEENFVFWFTAMLRMINLHRATFDSPLQSTSQRPHALLDQSRLLITICCIALSRSPLGLVSRQEAQPPSSHLPSERPPAASNSLQTYALDIAATLVDTLPDDARQQCARFLKERCPPFLHVQNEPRFLYILGPVADTVTSSTSQQGPASSPAPSGAASAMTPSATCSAPSSSANTTTLMSTGMTAGSDALANRLRVLNRGRVMGPYPLRPWEMLEEAAPMAGINDTAVGLGFFGARKVRE